MLSRGLSHAPRPHTVPQVRLNAVSLADSTSVNVAYNKIKIKSNYCEIISIASLQQTCAKENLKKYLATA